MTDKVFHVEIADFQSRVILRMNGAIICEFPRELAKDLMDSFAAVGIRTDSKERARQEYLAIRTELTSLSLRIFSAEKDLGLFIS